MTRGNIKGADITRRRKKLGMTRAEYANRLAMPESTLWHRRCTFWNGFDWSDDE